MGSYNKTKDRTISLRLTDEDYKYLLNQLKGKHNNLSKLLRSTIQAIKMIAGENNSES